MADSPSTRENSLRGIALIVAALACFSCSDAAAKAMTAVIPPIEVAWIRYVMFTLLILGATGVSERGKRSLVSRRPGLQIIRGLGLFGSSIFFITSLSFLPMAEATAISFVSPIFMTALSIPLLGETVGLRRWAAVFIGLIGVIIVVRPGTSAFEPAALFPIGTAVSAAVGYVFTRKIGDDDRSLVALLYAALVGLAVISPVVPFVWVQPGWREIGLGIVVGIASTLAQWLVVLAFKSAKASVLAPFSYSQIVWSGLLGFVIFKNLPDAWTIAGTLVIIASGLYTAHRERVRHPSAETVSVTPPESLPL